jgi:predicted AlkP superfamily pyrophosphatase or phosphodiesterase
MFFNLSRMGGLLLAMLLAALVGIPAAVAGETPRLIVQITVDALRGDLPNRYLQEMGNDGFRWLFQKGIHYTDAHYLHANTETIVGHSSLSTGTVPAAHGMIGNIWFDRDLGRTVYNIEDPDYVLLTAGASVDANTEIDPTQRVAKVEGRSPRAILSSTFADELTIATQGRAKVFGVSVKDRGAVAMAGHTGKAFWFSKATGEWVTSSYYYDRYPQWVETFNAADPAARYGDQQWRLLHEQDRYLFADRDDQPFETDFPGFGRTFPHDFGSADDKYFTTRLTLSPAGDELTLDFARALIAAEELGQDAVPDYLSISFSANDYVNHIFGPSSLEAEDNLLHLDRTLGALFDYLDREVGLKHTLIVLSADHGSPEAPGFSNDMGLGLSKYFDAPELDDSPLVQRLKDRFGIDGVLIESYNHPYLYLNDDVISAAGLDREAVERATAEIVAQVEGVALAVSSAALRSGQVPDSRLVAAVRENFHPKRSGDVYVVFEPGVFINDFDGLTVASTHGSPWRYDTYVPVLFAGAGVRAQSVARRITPYDIAPTLSAVLGIAPPSATIGSPLIEVMSSRSR